MLPQLGAIGYVGLNKIGREFSLAYLQLKADKNKLMRGAVALALTLTLAACSNSKTAKVTKPTDTEVSQNSTGVPVERPQAEVAAESQTSSQQSFAALPNTSASENIISNKTKFSSKSYGVAGSPRVTTSKDVRKGGGRYQVGKPYTIRGIRYVPKEDPNYKAVGLASWYGPNFHGRLTANGEVYDQFALSAAHPTMPLPSYARVTNLENGAAVIVRVNDRGPFSKSRVIDLSSRAAQLLGYTKKGVAKVRVEYVGKARMDGLDENYLVASYSPGNLPVSQQPKTVLASNTSTIPVVTTPATKQVSTPSNSAETFNQERFGELKPRPVTGLASSYAANEPKTSAAKALDAMIAPSTGMQNLQIMEVGPIISKAELFKLSELASEFGPVTIFENEDTLEYKLRVSILNDQVDTFKSRLQTK